MKKVLVCLMVVSLMVLLVGCGGKKCSECGTRFKDGEGYELFGRDFCEDCFI